MASLAALLLGAVALIAPYVDTTAPRPAVEVIGRSTEGRPIRALRIGPAHARVKLIVVGAVHGNEPAGKAIVDRLRRVVPPAGMALWLIRDANPDGTAANGRHNAAGVDLNRNFPFRWRPQDGVYESGRGPASEPETRAVQRFVRRERPRVMLWYHQALRMVVKTGNAGLERLYSRRSGLPRKALPRYHGTATSWQNSTFPRDAAFVVELPGGRLPAADVRRHANAVMALARAVAPPPGIRQSPAAGEAGSPRGAQG